jgi:hypothetical protein
VCLYYCRFAVLAQDTCHARHGVEALELVEMAAYKDNGVDEWLFEFLFAVRPLLDGGVKWQIVFETKLSDALSYFFLG